MEKAKNTDLNSIFLMGYDVWGQNLSEVDYLESCHNSKKYESGNWFVLRKNGLLVSSLIAYSLSEKNAIGIGSIATSPSHRNLGFASQLVEAFILTNKDQMFYLWSDIQTSFYEKFGFRKFPEQFQTKSGSALMILCEDQFFQNIMNDKNYFTPEYF